jgi:SEFIR domain
MAANELFALGLRLVRGVQGAIDSSSTPEFSSARRTARSPSPPVVSSGRDTPSPTAFISWAHSHSTWSKEQTSNWESQVAALAALLRRLGIRADVDLFHLDEQIDWTRYGPQQIQAAKFTLVVMSEAWAERWSGTNSRWEGAGAAAEADTLRGLFARDQEAWQRRVILVMFPEVDSEVVPLDFQRVARVPVDPSDPDSFDGVIRMLTDQPRYPKPPVGRVPLLGAAFDYDTPAGLASLQDRLSAIERRRKQLRNRTSVEAQSERAQLDLTESATRGFIDAELSIEE